MLHRVLPIGIMAVLIVVDQSALAQRPRVRARVRVESSGSENLPRRANDQIEGSIYQFSATLPKSKDERLTGRFRIEEAGIFSVQKEIDRPKARESIRKLKDGGGTVSVQTQAREKRIGDVIPMGDGKYKLKFMDFDTLPGFAVIWPKKDHRGVYMGYFQELEDGEAGRRWKIEVRKSED